MNHCLTCGRPPTDYVSCTISSCLRRPRAPAGHAKLPTAARYAADMFMGLSHLEKLEFLKIVEKRHHENCDGDATYNCPRHQQ